MSDERLQRYLPVWTVMRLRDGQIQGLIELSLSMDWDANRTSIFWSGKAYSMLGEHMLDAQADAQHHARRIDEFAIDLMAPECPVSIDWDSWFQAWKNKRKFDSRNARFIPRQGGLERMIEWLEQRKGGLWQNAKR